MSRNVPVGVPSGMSPWLPHVPSQRFYGRARILSSSSGSSGKSPDAGSRGTSSRHFGHIRNARSNSGSAASTCPAPAPRGHGRETIRPPSKFKRERQLDGPREVTGASVVTQPATANYVASAQRTRETNACGYLSENQRIARSESQTSFRRLRKKRRLAPR